MYTCDMANRRLEIIAANWGRDAGWFVEHAGCVIAVADDPVWDPMFWHSYRLVPASPEDRVLLGSNEFWDRCDFTLRNRRFGDAAMSSLPCGSAGDVFRETGRVSFRGDAINVPDRWWDPIALWLRGKLRR